MYFKDIKLDVSLDNNSEFLDFNAEINNKKKNHKLQFVVKTNENISKTNAQDALGVIERKIDYNYKMQDYMPAKKPMELKTNSYPMQNFVAANDVSILTKGLNEYEIYKNEINHNFLTDIQKIFNINYDDLNVINKRTLLHYYFMYLPDNNDNHITELNHLMNLNIDKNKKDIFNRHCLFYLLILAEIRKKLRTLLRY